MGFIRTRFLSFAMVGGVCFLLLVSLTVETLLRGLRQYLQNMMPGGDIVALTLFLLFDMAVVVLLFAMIFRYLPDAKIEWRDVWVGATLTAVLFALGKFALGFYLGWLRFQEKRGKEHEVPVHSKAKEAVDLWLERSHLASNPSAPLFPSFGKNRETIESRRLDRRSVLKLVEKRAKTSGILKRVCCHSFRATGVTEYMNSGGTIEIAQRIAGHTSPATTRIYDRSGDRLTLEEIERVQIGALR